MNSLIDGAWGRTCAECGSGMNLHLDNNNPQCKCKQDSLVIHPGYTSSESYRAARGFPARPKSSYSPRPPSASSCSLKSSGSLNTSPSINGTPTALRAEKILLRYTDGGIKRPLTPAGLTASTNSLPRLVRRYIGRRSIQCHELPLVNASSAVFIDTSQLHNPLSITSHGVANRWTLKCELRLINILFLEIFIPVAGTTPCTHFSICFFCFNFTCFPLCLAINYPYVIDHCID